ncbi:MAG TPA: pyruvate kinase [Acidimicrobiales bacterium]|nr:pyruvate kinase [Acidimicrobiales bacterium]
MPRRTKIVATIGPASESEPMLRALINAGVDVTRLGLAHGTVEEALERYHRIRRVAEEEGKHVGILVDLPGPKVRAASFGDSAVDLPDGHIVRLTVGHGRSTADVIEVEYDSLLDDIQIGDRLVLGDGTVQLDVREKQVDKLVAEIISGGEVSGRPGVHIPSDRLSISTPTTEDLRAIDAFVDVGVDMIALSFVRSAHDVRRVGTEIYPRGPLVIAKIETRAAVQNLAGIIDAAGAIMVARGDLGNECTIEELPYLQKQIIRDCIAGGRPVITATQMLESMIESAAPTRAEASDVANAVWDGSSAVMLSAETAIGVDPVNVVRTMHRIVRRADESFDYGGWAANLAKLRMTKNDSSEHSVTDAMTMAAWRAASELGLSTIVCISGSGFTVRSMARFRPTARILGFSHNPRTVKQLTLSWGTTSIQLDAGGSNEEMVRRALMLARDAGYVRAGELVAVLAGMSTAARSTNVLRVETVP